MSTYLLTWKPKEPDEGLELDGEDWRWSCGNRKNIKVGERVFVLRQGKNSPGIVASGWVSEGSHEDDHWDPAKRKLRKKTWYVWVDGKETDQVSDSTEDALPRAKLIRKKTLPARLLNSQASGVEVPLEYAEKLERLWSKHLKLPLKTSSLVISGISALEGEPIEHRSYRRKRDQRLRRAALDASNGVCAVCDVDYSRVLNGKGVRVLQAHHKRQFSQSAKPKLNTQDDLAVVCANCHALIHMNSKKALAITSLRSMLGRLS